MEYTSVCLFVYRYHLITEQIHYPPLNFDDDKHYHYLVLTHRKLTFELLINLASGYYQIIEQAGQLRCLIRKHWKIFCSLLIGCFWVLLGLVVFQKVSGFQLKLWNKKHPKPNQPLVHQQWVLLRRKQHQVKDSPKGAGKWRKVLLRIFIVVGIVGSIWLFWYLNQTAILRREETLANMCDERARMLQDQFNVSMNHVHALAVLTSTFHHGKQPSAIDQAMLFLFAIILFLL